jgi:hypothetical protein
MNGVIIHCLPKCFSRSSIHGWNGAVVFGGRLLHLATTSTGKPVIHFHVPFVAHQVKSLQGSLNRTPDLRLRGSQAVQSRQSTPRPACCPLRPTGRRWGPFGWVDGPRGESWWAAIDSGGRTGSKAPTEPSHRSSNCPTGSLVPGGETSNGSEYF